MIPWFPDHSVKSEKMATPQKKYNENLFRLVPSRHLLMHRGRGIWGRGRMTFAMALGKDGELTRSFPSATTPVVRSDWVQACPLLAVPSLCSRLSVPTSFTATSWLSQQRTSECIKKNTTVPKNKRLVRCTKINHCLKYDWAVLHKEFGFLYRLQFQRRDTDSKLREIYFAC